MKYVMVRRSGAGIPTGALERAPEGTRATVRELIETLSGAFGIEVEIKTAVSESASA